MNGPTRRLAMGLFLAFGVLLGATTWFQVVAADTYRSDPRNARTALNISGKERGLIVSADGRVLAQSVPDPDVPHAFLRRYPAGPAFSHLVGYTSRLVGSAGLEAAYGERLRSRRDLTISDLIAALFGRDLRPLNLQLTIDGELQRAAFAALAGQRGAVVALDPATGEILAYVSSPSFDVQPLLDANAVDYRQPLLDDPLAPLRDRAGAELYAPGSTFKTVVAAAAFEAGVAGPETEFENLREFPLPQSTAVIRNFGGTRCGEGPTVTLQAAFVRSCNTVFAELAIRVGAEELDRTATAFGFNREISFPLPVAESVFPGRSLLDDPAALAQSGIGQRDVRSTTLLMAMVTGAIANDGDVMGPRVVSHVFDADGRVVSSTQPEVLDRAMSPASAAVLQQMMERVVTEGTGRRAAISGIRVAGKTGTTERPDAPPHLWFVGFAPVENPRIAVAVLVESGGHVGESATGGTVAAPIAASIIATYLDR